jgi:hypothetical protein
VEGDNIFVLDGYTRTVGEYTSSGSVINAALISGLNVPAGFAVSGNNIFVANDGDGTIGEYTTSGVTINASLISGLASPNCLAVYGNELFVAGGLGQDYISVYTTDGTLITPHLLSVYGPEGMIIVPVPEPTFWTLSVLGLSFFVLPKPKKSPL